MERTDNLARRWQVFVIAATIAPAALAAPAGALAKASDADPS